MAARSIASLSLTFGLVSIPIKLYSATESTSAIRFKLMGASGSRVRQQYVTDAPAPAEAEPLDEEPAEAAGAGSARRSVARRRLSAVQARRRAGFRAAKPSPHRPSSSVRKWSRATNSRKASSSCSAPTS